MGDISDSESSGREEVYKLEKQVQDEYRKAINDKRIAEKEKAFLRQQAIFEEELLKFKRSRISTSEGRDGKIHEESDWDAAIKKGKEGSNVETTSYNSEFKICMLACVAILIELNLALHNAITELSKPIFFSLRHKLLPEVLDKIKSTFTSDPEAVIPTLLHGVQLNDKNALEVSLTAEGKIPGALSFDEQFKRVVVEWLKEQGYTPNPDPENSDQFVNSAGEVLVPEVFNELKNDPEHGIDHFLRETTALQFRPR